MIGRDFTRFEEVARILPQVLGRLRWSKLYNIQV